MRRSGRRERVAPHDLTSLFDSDPIVDVAAPRPDFRAALVQLWIGWVQTCCAFQDRTSKWDRRFTEPPSPDQLRESFAPIVFAFELDGESPRFLQDWSVLAESPESEPIDALLIDSPANEHFRKVGTVEALCRPCAASALLTLQINAPQGGRGHLTGLRGGGPLTTLVRLENLWATVWANVLPLSACGATGPQDRGTATVFPWLACGPASSNGWQKTVSPPQTTWSQLYWPQPRRLFLEFQPNHEAMCSLCLEHDSLVALKFRNRPGGVSYEGLQFLHPLTPYRRGQAAAELLPVSGRAARPSYRHWLGLVQHDQEGDRSPARVVAETLQHGVPTGLLPRLWVSGYAMNKMSALSWHESTLPLVLVEASRRASYEASVSGLVAASRLASSFVVEAVKSLVAKDGKRVRGDLSAIEERFFRETESLFFRAIARLASDATEPTAIHTLRSDWFDTLRRSAEKIFDEVSQCGAFDAVDPGQVATAWNRLQSQLNGPKLHAALGLASSATSANRKRGKDKRAVNAARSSA